MKTIIRSLISMAVQNDFIWIILDKTILRLARYAEMARTQFHDQQQLIDNAIMKICPDLVVKNGLFKGMKYPGKVSRYSTLFPKLIGSYEKELLVVFEEICKQEYTHILNIGCAEGYYAVGLAMRFPSAAVYAYDIDKDAIRLCRNMAKINGVEERVHLASVCDINTLEGFSSTKKCLIISDCEGCEKDLFTQEIAKLFNHHDFLIEIHDFVDITISSIIRQRFERTHLIKVVKSIDDLKKAQLYFYEELKRYNHNDKKILLQEKRPTIMEWFYMTPKF